MSSNDLKYDAYPPPPYFSAPTASPGTALPHAPHAPAHPHPHAADAGTASAPVFMVQPPNTPIAMFCPACKSTVTTTVNRRPGFKAGALAVGTAFVFWPAAVVPLMMNRFKDVLHVCPRCRTILAINKA